MTTRPPASTVSATNPPFGANVEFGYAIKIQAEQISSLEQELNQLKQANAHNDALCKAYIDLHRLRFLSLILFPILSLFIIGLFLYNAESTNETSLWIFRAIGLILSASILKEAFSLPNQIKLFDEKLNKLDAEVKKLTTNKSEAKESETNSTTNNRPPRGRPKKQ